MEKLLVGLFMVIGGTACGLLGLGVGETGLGIAGLLTGLGGAAIVASTER